MDKSLQQPEAVTDSRWLLINYGINCRSGRRIEHRYGKLRIKGRWLNDDTMRKIHTHIRRRHPGWLITGYCLLR